jgi:hypothetical protein
MNGFGPEPGLRNAIGLSDATAGFLSIPGPDHLLRRRPYHLQVLYLRSPQLPVRAFRV